MEKSGTLTNGLTVIKLKNDLFFSVLAANRTVIRLLAPDQPPAAEQWS